MVLQHEGEGEEEDEAVNESKGGCGDYLLGLNEIN